MNLYRFGVVSEGLNVRCCLDNVFRWCGRHHDGHVAFDVGRGIAALVRIDCALLDCQWAVLAVFHFGDEIFVVGVTSLPFL